MTKEELAKKLDGNQYGDEISKELEIEAKENSLVVVFGASLYWLSMGKQLLQGDN